MAGATSYLDDSPGQLLTAASCRWLFDQYLGDWRNHGDPRFAVTHADLRGLPPTLVITAEYVTELIKHQSNLHVFQAAV